MRFTILAFLLAASFAAHAQSNCEARYENDREVRIQVGANQIIILGWVHLDDKTGKRLSDGLKSVLLFARAGVCDVAANFAKAVLSKLDSDVQSADRVYKRFFELQLEVPFKSIGLEMTSQELKEQRQFNKTIDRLFREFHNLCEPELQQHLITFRIMLPGPEFEFQQTHPNVSLIPLEDQAAKNANEKDFDGEAEDTFNFSNPKFTPETKIAIEAIRKDIQNQVQPSDLLIQQVLAYEKDEVERAKLEAQLRYSIARGMRIVAGAYKRNVEIAKRLVKIDGDIVVPIGFRHVNHLVDETVRRCREK